MSAIFGERLTFGQENGPDVLLMVYGDEFYARYENLDGYSVVYNPEMGLFTYATLIAENLVSSGVPISDPPPGGVPRHLIEPETTRHEKFTARQRATNPPTATSALADTLRTFGPNKGLLSGRRLSSGSVRGLTILVEFQDVTSTVTRDDVDELLNGQNYNRNGNFCSVREYFQLMSSGRLDYSNVVVGPYRLSKNRMHYANQLLVKEALDLAVADGVDLTQFDSQGTGIIDAVNILYAGRTQYLGELWPHNSYLKLRYGNLETYFYMLTSMGLNSSQLTIGTFCHESTHLLCRCPDLYDYGNRDGDGVESAGIGVYCLMGAGNHLNGGRTPSPISAYLRYLLDWHDQEILLNSAGQHEILHGDYNTAFKYETDRLNEYFLVENRSKLGLDAHLPASGLAVYHCDILGSNELQEGSSTRHYQCALIQADGRLDLERNINQGDGADLFGAVVGTALSHATNPSSRVWAGHDSGLLLSNITGPGERIRFDVGRETLAQFLQGEASPGEKIPDNVPQGISSTIELVGAGTIGHVQVSVDITHTYIGDLLVELVSPQGSVVRLHERAGGGRDNLIETFDATLVQGLADLVGQPAAGEWTLHVSDRARRDVGKLNRWSIEIGLKPSAEPIRVDAAPNLPIPDHDPVGVTSTLEIDQPGTVQDLKVGLDITHTYVGDLKVTLTSPSGRQVILHGRLGGSQDDLVTTYTSAAPSPLAMMLGQPMQGTWMLNVADLAPVDTGTLNKWSLEITPG